MNGPYERVAIIVPRPELGDLVPAFNNETTLYGAELRFTARTGNQEKQATWSEVLYDADTNRVRHEIEQRTWRIARGEATEAGVSASLARASSS